MNRHIVRCWALLTSAILAATGCHPQQPIFFFDDHDLSHYMDVATDIEYPDVDEAHLDEVTGSKAPLTLENLEDYERWELSLEEVFQLVLANSQVMRTSGGRLLSTRQNPVVERAFDSLSRRLVGRNIVTTYDPAIAQSAYGVNIGSTLGTSNLGGIGPEAALSEFDTQFTSNIFWNRTDRPQNVSTGMAFGQAANLQQDLANFDAGFRKTTATGGTLSLTNRTNYELNNRPLAPVGFQALRSFWDTSFEFSASHPLLQGAGAQYNRIAGPYGFDEYDSGFINPIDGVVIARINTDLTLADFEGQLVELMRETEEAYMDLYYAFRDLEAKKTGRDSALKTWVNVKTREAATYDEAQARAQYYLFRSEVEAALSNLLSAENRLRYLMGLAVSDGRLITPSDEPTNAHVAYDWHLIHPEAVCRRVEIRKQKWEIKRRELELIAVRNHLLPRLDAVGAYRFVGAGNDLISSNRSGLAPQAPGSNAFETLTGGNFQEWEMGLRLSIPIGFRRALSSVRHHQLLLARERALLDDVELEISHQLGDALRSLVAQYKLTQTNFNRRVAAEQEVAAFEAAFGLTGEAGRPKVSLDLLLDAQRRRADAEVAYYRSLVDYNLAIMSLHYRKGSLLEYNSVYMAEGPWPKKAYFDAMREARKRDSGTFIDYGFTRPSVFSRGPYQQQGDHSTAMIPQDVISSENLPEEIPSPPSDAETEPLEPPTAPDAPQARQQGEPETFGQQGPVLQGPRLTSRTERQQEWKASTRASQAGSGAGASSTSERLEQPKTPAPSRAPSSGGKPKVIKLSFEEFSKSSKNETFQNQTSRSTSSSASGWKRSQRQ